MKIVIVLGALFLAGGAGALGLVAYAALARTPGGEPSAQVPATPGTQDSLTLNVPGMHCEFACAPKVRETLAGIPGVEDVETSVDDKTATIVAGDDFALETALAKLDEAGYPATVRQGKE